MKKNVHDTRPFSLTRRIKDTSKKARRLRVTSPLAPAIAAQDVAEALGLEPVGRVPKVHRSGPAMQALRMQLVLPVAPLSAAVMSDPRQQLVQLLRASVACSYCNGWGRIWFRSGTPVAVPHRWGYTGWPMKALGTVALREVRDCPICRGTGEQTSVFDSETPIEVAFAVLAREWKDACVYSSSLRVRIEHPAYQRIIEMGDIAVPLILTDLLAGPEHWGPALAPIRYVLRMLAGLRRSETLGSNGGVRVA